MINRLNLNYSACSVQKQNKAAKKQTGFGVSLVPPEQRGGVVVNLADARFRANRISERLSSAADIDRIGREYQNTIAKAFRDYEQGDAKKLMEENERIRREVTAKYLAEQQAKPARETPKAAQPGLIGRILSVFQRNK